MVGNSLTNKIYVYIADDFASNMTSCTPSSADDGKISEAEVQGVIEQAMEVWNQESTGTTLDNGPDILVAGDHIIAGVRYAMGEQFLQNFVFVNPTRGQMPQPANLPDVATRFDLDMGCRSSGLSHQDFEAFLTSPIDIHCKHEPTPTTLELEEVYD